MEDYFEYGDYASDMPYKERDKERSLQELARSLREEPSKPSWKELNTNGALKDYCKKHY